MRLIGTFFMIFFGLGLVSAQSFSPPVGDTILLSYDSLHLFFTGSGADFCRRGFVFNLNKSHTMIPPDTIVWKIDDSIPVAGIAEVYTGQNSSQGFYSSMYLPADMLKQNLKTGTHHLDFFADLNGKQYNAKWYFKYMPFHYDQFEARLKIEKFDASHYQSPVALSIVSAKPLDTTIFKGFPISSDTNRLFHDYILTNTFYYSSRAYEYVFNFLSEIYKAKPGDSIHTFLLQGTFLDTNYIWAISTKYEYFLKENAPPFDFKTARSCYSSTARLGPLFYLQAGDPGWALTAYHDSLYWYFNEYEGWGDCPAGCTEGTRKLSRVSHPCKDSVIQCSSTWLGDCPQTSIYEIEKKTLISNSSNLIHVKVMNGNVEFTVPVRNSPIRSFRIFDFNGSLLAKRLNPGLRVIWNKPDLPAGAYTANVIFRNGQTMTQRFVIKR